MSILIVGQGGLSDPQAIEIQTRKGRRLRNERRLETPTAVRKEAVRIILDNYKGTELISSTALYNCFGLAFAARRTWIHDEVEVKAVLEDDGFRPVSMERQFWEVGDVVLYCKGDGDIEIRHVAVIVEKRPIVGCGGFEIRVVSAWGESGEYLHPVDVASPLHGRPYRVYSQRKSPDDP
jgi:hypothetical protein